MSLRFLTFTLWSYYIVKLLCLEIITFSDATLSDINIVLCDIFSQYRFNTVKYMSKSVSREKT